MKLALKMTALSILTAAFFFVFYLVTMEYGYIRYEQGARSGFQVGYNKCYHERHPQLQTNTGELTLEDSTT
jgi:hypothetical protein